MSDIAQHDIEAASQAEFETWLVEAYLAASDIDEANAKGFAAAWFDGTADNPAMLTFGDPDYAWTREDAATLVSEDMSYWQD